MIEARGLDVEKFADGIGVSRATVFNWFKRETAPPSQKVQERLAEFLREPRDYVLHGRVPVQHSKTGKSRISAAVREEVPADKYATYAPADSDSGAPARPMPTRRDCEDLLGRVLDAAEGEGSPENIPVIFHRLKKQFPIEEWEKTS